ncbi:MFS transporter [Paenibacillus herberti]|uniref:MFS transporter n=1 Tax=Paenibacillus herberti TaxID=1619309 RepID=A0A229NUS6_9BACL|nr:MFS transporter [Paenibacillus herberti]OXM13485.1 MFS transporter [Paenibacillus herberti]
MIDLFRNRIFTRLFIATVCSQLASTIGTMAFAFYLLDRFTSQPAYASIAEMLYSAPTIVVFLFIGVFADRFDRKRIAENTGWIRAVLSILILAALAAKVWIPIVFLLLFLRSAVTKFYFPAENAMIQGLLREDQYVQASGLNQTAIGVFTLFGTGLGAVVYYAVGVLGALTIDALGFLITALLVRSVSVPVEVRLPNGSTSFSALNMKVVWGDFRGGFHYILSSKLLLSLISGFVLFGLIGGSFTMLPMLTMKYELAPTNYAFFVSLYSLFLGAGLIIGSVLGAKLLEKFKLYQILIVCLLLIGCCVTMLGFASSPWVYLMVTFITACIMAPLDMAIGGWLPKLVEPSMMGRVSAWLDPVKMAGQTLMLGLIAWLYPSAFTLLGLHLFVAGLLFLTCLVYALTLPKFARQEEATRIQTKTGAVVEA